MWITKRVHRTHILATEISQSVQNINDVRDMCVPFVYSHLYKGSFAHYTCTYWASALPINTLLIDSNMVSRAGF
jgi:UDP-galactopyranose mutase